MSLKRIMLIGNVVADATITNPPTGNKSVINFTVAHNERFTNTNGQKQENASFFECALWKPKDQTDIAQYIKKGSKIYVEGDPEIRLFKRKNGETSAVIKINVHKIDTNRIVCVGSGKEEQQPVKENVSNSNDNDLPY
jgi:single-strand DNA-binding protein